jgi:hypothetical protein
MREPAALGVGDERAPAEFPMEALGPDPLGKRLQEIRDELQKWTARTSGLLRLSPEQLSARTERQLREMEERRKPPEARDE